MIVKDLAPGMSRDDKGWYHFPRDVEERRKLFPPEVFHHPAKMHLGLARAIIDAYTKPGDHILDPFGGTGTTAIAALSGRRVTLIELEPNFCSLIVSALALWREMSLECEPVTVLQGDSRRIMEELVSDSFSHVITSPPYASTMAKTQYQMPEVPGLRSQVEDAIKYAGKGTSPFNLGRINAFLFNEAMQNIYRQAHRVLQPGGLYVSVTKDYISGGRRMPLGADTIRSCQALGLTFTGDWFKWLPQATAFKSIQKSKGSMVVEDEDIIVFQKEK